MMDMDLSDHLPRKAGGPLSELEDQELATFSLDELEERITRLKREIERVEGIIAEKEHSLIEASAAFKS